MVVKLIS